MAMIKPIQTLSEEEWAKQPIQHFDPLCEEATDVWRFQNFRCCMHCNGPVDLFEEVGHLQFCVGGVPSE
jgi:hypothetical protein